MVTDEFECRLVIVVDSFVGEGFIRTAHGDVVTVLAPTDIDLVRGDTIKICKRALDGSAVDIDGIQPRLDGACRTAIYQRLSRHHRSGTL